MKASTVTIFRMVSASMMLCSLHASSLLAANLGFKFGLASSDQTTDGYGLGFPSDVTAVKHPTLGLMVSSDLGPLRIVPSIGYVKKGRDEAFDLYGKSEIFGRFAVRVFDEPSYVSLQMDLQATFNLGDGQFYLTGGPRMDFHVSTDRRVYSGDVFGPATFPAIPEYNSTVLGATVGIGQDIKVGRHTLLFEVRYDRDITPALEVWSENGFGDPKLIEVVNRTVMFQMGFRLWTSKPNPVESGIWLPVNAPLPN